MVNCFSAQNLFLGTRRWSLDARRVALKKYLDCILFIKREASLKLINKCWNGILLFKLRLWSMICIMCDLFVINSVVCICCCKIVAFVWCSRTELTTQTSIRDIGSSCHLAWTPKDYDHVDNIAAMPAMAQVFGLNGWKGGCTRQWVNRCAQNVLATGLSRMKQPSWNISRWAWLSCGEATAEYPTKFWLSPLLQHSICWGHLVQGICHQVMT